VNLYRFDIINGIDQVERVYYLWQEHGPLRVAPQRHWHILQGLRWFLTWRLHNMTRYNVYNRVKEGLL